MTGLRTAETLGRISVPAVGGSASNQVTPVAVSGSIGPGTGQVIVTGSLVTHDGRLLLVKADDYDGDTELGQTHWIKSANTSVASQGSFCTMNASNGAYVRRLAGPLGHLDALMQELFGTEFNAITMGCRMSIVSRAQNGYGLGLFHTDDVQAGGGAVDVRVLLDYPFGPTTSLEPDSSMGATWTAYPKNANGGTDLYSPTNAYLGTGFRVPGSRSFVFVTCHGYGTDEVLGCRTGSSVDNHPFRMQEVYYDCADLWDVFNGDAETYEPRPYMWRELTDWDVAYGDCVGEPSPGAAPGNFCYDPANSRLYGMADGVGGFPSYSPMQVWSVGSLSP
jgi:hypothetical protein